MTYTLCEYEIKCLRTTLAELKQAIVDVRKAGDASDHFTARHVADRAIYLAMVELQLRIDAIDGTSSLPFADDIGAAA